MCRFQRQCMTRGFAPARRGTFVSAKVPKAICPAVFALPLKLGRGTSDFACLSGSADGTSDLHGWRKCKGLSGTILALCRRRTPACGASLSPLLLASPGLAIRGEPVQRDKGPLDLCLYPLHPARPPHGAARCTGTYECRECRMHTSGLRLHSSDVQEAQVPRAHGSAGAALARPKGRKTI